VFDAAAPVCVNVRAGDPCPAMQVSTATARDIHVTGGNDVMATAKESLPKLLEIDGCLGACIVDSDSGMTLGTTGSSALDLEIAAAGNTEVVRAMRKTMKALNLQDAIEDMLITLGKAYHMLRPLRSNEALFVYLLLDKQKANLAMARHQLKEIEKNLVVT
jgi:hypothetical protein